jgi:hypothetical protein
LKDPAAERAYRRNLDEILEYYNCRTAGVAAADNRAHCRSRLEEVRLRAGAEHAEGVNGKGRHDSPVRALCRKETALLAAAEAVNMCDQSIGEQVEVDDDEEPNGVHILHSYAVGHPSESNSSREAAVHNLPVEEQKKPILHADTNLVEDKSDIFHAGERCCAHYGAASDSCSSSSQQVQYYYYERGAKSIEKKIPR